MQMAQVKLDDGRSLDYEIRTSARAKSVRLKLTARDGLTVFAPQGVATDKVVELVDDKHSWISSKLTQFDEVRTLLGEMPTSCPQAFDLPAVAESWRVEYKPTRSKSVGAKIERQGRLVVYGATESDDRCNAALRRWLARRAKDALGERLSTLSSATGLTFKKLTIKSQKTRWGSCSATGVISLNCKLLFLASELVRYVIVHELCHLLEPNHSSRFWTHLRQFEPDADQLHSRMADGWKCVPPWANAHTSRYQQR